jgi:outer membrane protein TolC
MRFPVLTCILMLSPLAWAAQDETAPPVEALSLQQALELASARNPEVVIGRARQARAEAVRLQTGRAILPTVNLDATYLHADLGLLGTSSVWPAVPELIAPWPDLSPIEGSILGVQLVQPLVNVSAWHGREQAARRLDAARLRLARIADEVAVSTTEAYFGAVTAAELVQAAAGGRAAAQRALEQAEGAYAEGLVPRLDLLNARTRLADMEARVARAEAAAIAAKSALRAVLGLESDTPLELSDQVPEPPLDLATAGERPRERADVRAMEEVVAAAESGVKSARAGRLPEVNLFARYQQVDLNQPLNYDDDDWIVGVNLTWTVFSGFGVQGAIGEAQATAGELRAELGAQRRRAAREASDSRAWWQAELRAWQSARASVAGAEEALELAERRYAEGLGDMTDLLLAQANALEASTQSLNARYRALVAAQRHLLALGAQDPGRLPK